MTKPVSLYRLSDDELVRRFTDVTVWTRAGERAPHKPLLLLYALARLQRGQPRLVPFKEVEQDLGPLLAEFGPPRKTRPEYPYWHLQSDGIWEITNRELLQADVDRATYRHNPRLTVIRSSGSEGGFPEWLDRRLRNEPAIVDRITSALLEANFPSTIHQDLLDAVGMPWVVGVRRPRNPAFRSRVLRAYEHRCALCGLGLRIDDVVVAVEAAHIRWYQAGGPDVESNGLALCSLHHKLFDRGAFTLSDQREALVSEHAHDLVGLEAWLLRFSHKVIRRPIRTDFEPATDFIAWHRSQVFRGPAREPAHGH